MRIDLVSQAVPDPARAPAQDASSLTTSEVRMHTDQAEHPVPAAANVETQTEGNTPKRERVVTEDGKHEVYRVIDHTGNLVYQIPSEQVLQVADSIDQMIESSGTAEEAASGREVDVRS